MITGGHPTKVPQLEGGGGQISHINTAVVGLRVLCR